MTDAEREHYGKLFSGLSVRAQNVLHSLGVESRSQAAAITDSEMLRYPNFGRKTLREVRAWIAGSSLHAMEAKSRRDALADKITRARAELERAQEKLRWLEAAAAAYDTAKR